MCIEVDDFMNGPGNCSAVPTSEVLLFRMQVIFAISIDEMIWFSTYIPKSPSSKIDKLIVHGVLLTFQQREYHQ